MPDWKKLIADANNKANAVDPMQLGKPQSGGSYSPGGFDPSTYDWSQGRREQTLGGMWGIDTDVPNRFDGYTPEFDFDKMSGTLDDVYKRYIGDAERSSAGAINKSNSDTAASMASQGITGGSIYNNQLNKGRDNINSGFQKTLGQLGTSKMAQTIPMMDNANKWQFAGLEAASNSDFKSLMAALQKAGLIGGFSNAWDSRDLENEKVKDADTGILGDALSIGGLLTGIPGIENIFGGEEEENG